MRIFDWESRMLWQSVWTFTVLIWGVSSAPPEGHPLQVEKGADIDPNGGYHVTLALQTDTNQPDDVELHIQNIQATFELASELLHNATKGTFYFASVNVIIPSHWETDTYDNQSISLETIKNFESSNIRMSRHSAGVHVQNSNLCGLPGHHIDLPLNFFEENSTSIYGPQHKALIVAWARYRWGVWEEHGYPGSSTFPYFYREKSTEQWEATGCSAPRMEGDIKSIQGTETCTVTDEVYPPQSYCRFQPLKDPADPPTSSLTYLPFVESVTEFCDETTHNHVAPNKQNLYCDYQSATQVMESTTDFKQIQEPFALGSLPNMSFTVRKQSRRPLFYLLVDASFATTINPKVLENVFLSVKTLFAADNLNIKDVIGKAATFSGDFIVPWTLVTENFTEFRDAAEQFLPQSNTPVPFPPAIDSVLSELVSRNHPYGASVLILKHGAYDNSFESSPTYEADMLSQLNISNIIVNAIEIRESIMRPKLHLRSLTEKSGGNYLSIDPTNSDIVGNVMVLVKAINEQFINFQKDASSLAMSGVLYKGFIHSGNQFTLPFNYARFPGGTQVEFLLTIESPLNLNLVTKSDLWITNGPTNHTIQFLEQTFEWGENGSGTNRQVVKLGLDISSHSFEEPWTFYYNGTEAFMVVRFTYPASFVITSDPLEILVTTSAMGTGNEVDFTKEWDTQSEPFKVYATVTMGGSPVVGLDYLVATLNDFQNRRSYSGFLLWDDGPNSVDVASGDGTYSGVIVPPQDGTYHLTVVVSGARKGSDSLVDYIHLDSAVHRLMTVDQKEVGCPSFSPGCSVVALERSTMQFVQYPEPLVMSGVDDWKVRAGRVLDLKAEAIGEFQVKLTWTEPYLYQKDGTAIYDSQRVNYTIRYAPAHKNLRSPTEFDNAESANLVDGLSFDHTAGIENQVTVETGASAVEFIFFALAHTIDDNRASEPSNIVGVQLKEKFTSTTTTTTTIAPPTTASPGTGSTETTPETTPSPQTGSTLQTSTSGESEAKNKLWYNTPEGIIVLTIFGGGIAMVFVLAAAYVIFVNRSKICGPSKPPYELNL